MLPLSLLVCANPQHPLYSNHYQGSSPSHFMKLVHINRFTHHYSGNLSINLYLSLSKLAQDCTMCPKRPRNIKTFTVMVATIANVGEAAFLIRKNLIRNTIYSMTILNTAKSCTLFQYPLPPIVFRNENYMHWLFLLYYWISLEMINSNPQPSDAHLCLPSHIPSLCSSR